MKKHESGYATPELESAPIRLNVKYSRETLIPGELVEGNHIAQRYKLVGGEIVTLLWQGAFDNTRGACEKDLDGICRELFDMDFPSVEAAWKRRLGSVSGWWQRVGMELSE